jgi:GNAT superfamily N-acetyltransferase
MSIGIRQISLEDAERITELSGQLGYTISHKQTEKNIALILHQDNHDAFVAIHNNEVIGWMGLGQSLSLESYPFCEIHGLVIDAKFRKQGVGKLLIDKAKQWAKEKGFEKIRLRCNIKRTETHLFYQHIGFKETKQQKIFEIEL